MLQEKGRFRIGEGEFRLKGYVQTFMKYRFLLANLITRDLKVKYRRSVLGLAWSVLNPLLMAFVITAVFQNFFKFAIENFVIYYLTGSLIFNFMTEATTAAMTSVINNSALIKKVYIPKYIFPLEKVMFSFVNMLFSAIALVLMLVITKLGWIGTPDALHIGWSALLFFVPMLYTLLFSLGLGLMLAAINVFFRDMGHLYSVATMAWMYLTPIIYPESMLQGSWVLRIVECNPMYYYVQYFRNLVMYDTLPGWDLNLICLGFSLLFLVLGLLLFKVKQDQFILYI